MASGFGTQGKTGRCYAFWMEFSKCMSEAAVPKDCRPARENYFECLHHKKEFTELNARSARSAAAGGRAGNGGGSGQ